MNLNNKKGFTLIELVISIFILSVALIGIFSSFSVITILTSNSTDRLTATYLAQEGMEIVRNIRDKNWLNIDAGIIQNAEWLDGLSVSNNYSIDCSNGCKADYTSDFMSPYVESDYLYLNLAGFYDHNQSGIKTKFRRKIIIDNSLAPYVAYVSVQVFWDEKPNILDSNPSSHPEKYSITAEETLYNWYNISVPSNDATVISAIYTVDSDANTIIGVPSNTLENVFINNLIFAIGATWDTSDLSSIVATGDTLVVTAQDGTTKKTYTITVDQEQ